MFTHDLCGVITNAASSLRRAIREAGLTGSTRALTVPILLVLLLCAPRVRAADLYVGPTGSDTTGNGSIANPYFSIQMGINSAASGDTVHVAAGTYSESITWSSKSLTLLGAGTGRSFIDPSGIGGAGTIANGGSGYFCMHLILVPATAVIDGFTLQNANTYLASGGIWNDFQSSPTIRNCEFNNNIGASGGGICNEGSQISVSNCSFTGNSGASGGIANFSIATISNCTFTNNSANAGGGIGSNAESLSVIDCTFSGNTSANNGGGAYVSGGSAIITGCTFSGNVNQVIDGEDPDFTGGGGLFISGNSTVTNCKFLRNFALGSHDAPNVGAYGGGILTFDGNPTILNCMFIGNSASTYGGAIATNGHAAGRGTIANCIFAINSSLFGGAMFFGVDTEGGPSHIFTITNCTCIQNTADFSGGGGGIIIGDSALYTFANCIIRGDTNGEIVGTTTTSFTNCDVQGGWPGTGNFDADPLFVRNLDPGPDGIFGTDDDLTDFHLTVNSPCINVGNNASLPPDTADLNGNGNTTESLPVDFDGNTRISRGTVDLGAYEYQNHAPTANAQSVSLNQDTTAGIAITGTDPDGDPLTYTIATNPANGTLSGTAPNLTYTPAGGYFGADIFTFTVTDPYGASGTATVSITVVQVNSPPNAEDDSDITPKNTPVTISVLDNDDDPDGDSLTIIAVGVPANGVAVINAGGTITYTPNKAFKGTDTFTYTISDGNGGTDTATVTVEVTGKDHPPHAVNDSATTARNTPVVIAVLANDTDADGDPLSIVGVTHEPKHGTAVINADGTITYTPNSGFHGHDRFRYRITDGNGKYDSAWVRVIVH